MKIIKPISLLLGCIIMAGCFQGCKPTEKKVEDENSTLEYSYATGTTSSSDQTIISDEFSKIIKEKFNIVIKYDKIPSSNWFQKLNLLFASGEEPDVISGGKENQFKPWAVKGFLKSLDPEKSNMTNYVSLFADKPWADVLKMVKSPDGKLYFLPSVRPGKAGGNWVYRKDIFDKLNLKFPKTTDEFYNVLKSIKKEYPNKVLISSVGNGNIYALGNFYQPFWMPDLLFQENSFVDPDTNEYIPYAFSTQRCRDLMIYLNKLYKERLIDQEILSLTRERYDQKLTTGSVVFQFGAATACDANNLKTRTVEPEANWDYSKDAITAYPERGTIFKKLPLYFDLGIVFSKKVSDVKMERILKYFDWTCSTEGRTLTTYGIEGLTYKKVDGKMVSDPDINDLTYNPKGTRYLSQYGIPSVQFNKPHDDYLNRDAKKLQINKEIEEHYFAQPKYLGFEQFLMHYSEEDDKQRVDIETAVNEVRDQMLTAFLMGIKDPNDNKEWDNYIATLNKVGLGKLIEIKTKTYKKSNKIN